MSPKRTVDLSVNLVVGKEKNFFKTEVLVMKIYNLLITSISYRMGCTAL